jgi:hypothetical protein
VREITIKIYKFEELSEEAQQNAISNLSDINVDREWWDIDGLLDLTQVEMDEAKVEPDEIEGVLFSYKISSFDLERGQYIQFENVVVNNEEAFRKFLKIPEGLWEQCAYYFHNCARDRNTFIEFALDNEENTTEEEYNILERAGEIMADKIHEAWVSLRNDYEYQTSEEAIKDTILANEYEFYENGKLI